MNDPVGPAIAPEIGPTRVPRRAILGCGAIVAAAAAWALLPVGLRVTVNPIGEGADRGAPAPAQIALDLDAFRAPIWVQAPAPVVPPEAMPPPPLKIQLLAVLRDGEIYRAALYDPDSDRIFVLAPGESVAGRTVERVLADGVALRDEVQVHTLSLVPGGAP